MIKMLVELEVSGSATADAAVVPAVCATGRTGAVIAAPSTSVAAGEEAVALPESVMRDETDSVSPSSIATEIELCGSLGAPIGSTCSREMTLLDTSTLCALGPA